MVYLGIDKWTGSIRTMNMRRRDGMLIFIAPSRWGKSCEARRITIALIRENPERTLLIIDPLDEWEKIKTSNDQITTRHIEPDCIPALKSYRNYKPKISDCNKAEDWLTMGISEDGAKYVANLARQKHIHLDNFDIFWMMIKMYPTTWDGLQKFRDTFPMLDYNIETTYAVTKQSMLKVNYLEGRFWKEGEPYVEDWFHELYTKRYIHISIGSFNDDIAIQTARAFFGIILRNINPFIWKLKPIVVFEEADILLPPQKEEQRTTSIFKYAHDQAQKSRRNGVIQIMITQDLKLLHPALSRPASECWFGYAPEDNPRRYLQMSRAGNWREFWYTRPAERLAFSYRSAPSPCTP